VKVSIAAGTSQIAGNQTGTICLHRAVSAQPSAHAARDTIKPSSPQVTSSSLVSRRHST
jgi:hypothetical protein